MPQRLSAMEVLRRNVVHKRAVHGLSQSELASHARVARQTISKLESGDGNVTVSVVEKIAHVLNCEVKDLFDRHATTLPDFIDAPPYSHAGRPRMNKGPR